MIVLAVAVAVAAAVVLVILAGVANIRLGSV